ncbi:hypothetical protein RIF29_24115 [Crotalaria pallida]|uniref:Uncharacterized protein n=1 Tax=Crotalaria pallida TaxID=3830 RepID=A0AAN9HZU8_CROPI
MDRKAIQQFVRKNEIYFIAIQETKLEVVDDRSANEFVKEPGRIVGYSRGLEAIRNLSDRKRVHMENSNIGMNIFNQWIISSKTWNFDRLAIDRKDIHLVCVRW